MRIRGVKKIYKTDRKQSVEALNGVSFELSEKGMIFILGKSGSGKSTLLNVMSGLDKADEGEIEVGGKDITKLPDKELSNYRNSCCGFVFQEYNLIPELNVGENIMLTLQLQGEREAERKVLEVLKQVDLVGYEKRKVTELSGGQKQRIAIARAIIKNPKIIFADEPTGALDEQTGQSVFDLLKKFSKDKLVVVVSHDRESAEKYGDRIIEISDGKIIRDSNAVELLQEEKESEWKKPKLPIKTAMKIGCSNFRYHPIRLVATIFLSVIAFTFLGVSLNISSKSFQDIVFNSMRSNQIEYSAINKYYKDSLVIPIKETEKQSLEKKVGESVGVINATVDIPLASGGEYFYYSMLPDGFAQISSDLINRFEFSLVGRLPDADNEIGLTKFSADIINYLCCFKENEEDIVGQHLEINGQEYLITAIIDTRFDFEKYASLKKVPLNTETSLAESFRKEAVSSLHNYIFVSDLTNYRSENIKTDKETCALYLTDNYSIGISELIKRNSSQEIYLLNNLTNDNFISAHLIPTVLQLTECDIEYNDAVFSNYGDLFRVLYGEECAGKTDVDDDLYIKVYEKYKEKYSFPTSFSCSVADKRYGLKRNITVNGFYSDSGNKKTAIISDELYRFFHEEIGGVYDRVFVFADNENVKSFIGQKGMFRLNNFVVENVIKYWDVITTTKTATYILSAIFALFSIGLLLNFMLQSITDKTKIIGVLKANGCNNAVLGKIFIAEGIIIACATFIFVALFVSIICLHLSKRFANFAVFAVNILIFPVLLIVILLFSIIGCILPIVRLRRYLPNDIIIRS